MNRLRRNRPAGRRPEPSLEPWPRVRRCLVLVAGVLLFGTVGYVVLGLSLLDAVYQTVTTVATVGFREVGEVDTDWKIFTIVLILSGVGIILYTATVLIETLIEGRLTDHLWRRRMDRQIANLTDHVIVCGCGRLGRTVAGAVTASGGAVVVVDRDLARLEQTPHPFVAGDATDDRTLQAAGLDRAATLVAALSTDADNLYVTLSARSARPDLFLIARARLDSAEPKLRQAGADRVVNPQSLGGNRVAAMAMQPNVADFVDVVMHDDTLEYRIEEFIIPTESVLAGISVREAHIRDRTGALVLALRQPDGTFLTNPAPDTVMGPGQVLIAIGTREQLRQLGEQAG